MLGCQRCKSERVARVEGKCSDQGFVRIPIEDYLHEGYMPELPGVCHGDYIAFSVCLDCGQIQGKFPVPSSRMKALSSRAPMAEVRSPTIS